MANVKTSAVINKFESPRDQTYNSESLRLSIIAADISFLIFETYFVPFLSHNI